MVAVLTVSIIFVLVALVAVFALRERLSSLETENKRQILPPRPVSFLETNDAELKLRQKLEIAREKTQNHAALLLRAENGDATVLLLVKDDNIFYREILSALVRQAKTVSQINDLAEFVRQAENLHGSVELAAAFGAQVWQPNPNRQSTGTMFYLAAVADDADFFQAVIVQAVTFQRAGDLPDLSANRLTELIASHFWLLAEHARFSGAGFLLKQKIADLRLGTLTNF